MEQFMKAMAEAADRRSFLRMVGRLGMGAAAVAGVLLPRQAHAACIFGGTEACVTSGAGGSSDKGGNPCYGKNGQADCTTKRGSGGPSQPRKTCHIQTDCSCLCS